MKKIGMLFITAVFITLMTTTAFAGTWKQDTKGWWWDNGDGTFPVSCWKWLDGDGNGVAECYYFGPDGYILVNTTTPDGYTVDGNGAWIVDGVVQTMGGAAADTSVAAANNNREYSREEDVAASKQIAAFLRTQLKFPSTLVVHGISAKTFQANGYTYREIKIDYSAANSLGMMVRDIYSGYIVPDGSITMNAAQMWQRYGSFMHTSLLSSAEYQASILK